LASEVNDYIIESVKLYPNKLVGFCGVNPNWGKKAIQEVERCATSGLNGVGEFHPDSQSFSIDDFNIMAPLVEVIQQNDFIVTTHSSEPVGHQYTGKGNVKPEILWKFLQNFPELTVVCAHWGGGLPFYALMPEVAEGLSNVYFDSAASPFLYSESIFTQVISLVGANRILMGSDFPLINQGRMLDLLEGVNLADSDKRAILSGNAADLLNIN
jgi:predicted TIM-barrel fold metal-dependent hydrolase